MTASLLLIVFSVLWLGFANGANDNFKGVATLFGAGTADFRKALSWGTATTLMGSLTAVAVGTRLVEAFSGKGLVPEATVADPSFSTAVGLGAAGTVLLATRFGYPISTTHSLVGALIGAGVAAQGLGGIDFRGLGSIFLLPLLLSPLLALGLTGAFYPILHRLRLVLGISRETCVCLGEELHVVAVESAELRLTAAAVAERRPSLMIGTDDACVERYNGSVVGMSAQTFFNRMHFLSAGAVGFARGLNDTPKILALLVTAQAFNLPAGMTLVGGAIALGGLIGSRHVADTMSHRITSMNQGQGLTANLVTAFLVIVASRFGVPVSTTHVSCGSLFGIGAANGAARWGMIGSIMLAWLITLPVAAALAAGTLLAGSALHLPFLS